MPIAPSMIYWILTTPTGLSIQITATEGLPNYSASYQAKLTLCSNFGTMFLQL